MKAFKRIEIERTPTTMLEAARMYRLHVHGCWSCRAHENTGMIGGRPSRCERGNRLWQAVWSGLPATEDEKTEAARTAIQ